MTPWGPTPGVVTVLAAPFATDTTQGAILAFVLSAALGALIGAERQFSHPATDNDYAGVRTFALYAVFGTGAAFLGDRFGPAAFAVAGLAMGALVIAEYAFAAVRHGDAGTTTEAAALVTFVVGALVWAERPVEALAVTVGVTALLRAKAFLYELTQRFSEADLRAFLRFAVLTAIVLPILPDRDFGPFAAFNPREIWLMVVLVSAIGLAGYVALRVLGPRGLAPTGLLGGLVSSTAVTLGFSRLAKAVPRVRDAAAAGVLAAGGLMFVRVLVEAAIIAPELVARLWIPLASLFVFVEGVAGWWWWKSGRARRGDMDDSPLEVRNPITLTSALQFGALYGAVVFVSKALVDRVSAESLNIVGAVSGINDVDAITLSTANLVRDGLDPAVGARVVLIAAVVNTLVKAGLAAAVGGKAFATRVGAILGVAAVAGFAWWILL